MGFTEYVNEVLARPAEQVHVAVLEDKRNVMLFMNCKSDNVRSLLGKPIADDMYQLGVSQNVLDISSMILPNDMYIGL